MGQKQIGMTIVVDFCWMWSQATVGSGGCDHIYIHPYIYGAIVKYGMNPRL